MALDPFIALLVLLSAAFHVAWNTFLRVSGDRLLTFGLMFLFDALVGLTLIGVVPLPAPEAWPYLIASGVVHVAYVIFLAQAYRYGELSLVYPLARGSNPLFATLLAIALANEIPQGGGVAGILLISAGIIGLTFSSGRPKGAALQPMAYALGTGFFIASYTVIDGVGIRLAGTELGYYAWQNLSHGAPFVIGLGIWRGRDFLAFARTSWKPGFLSGFVATVGYGIVLYALAHAPIAYVAALRETSVLMAALVGTYVLKEELGGRRIAAAVLVMLGLLSLQVLG
jgi:drug/metabolite transporter (DMT)-like permease